MSSLFEASAPAFDEAAAKAMVLQHFGIDGSATLLVSERDQNFRIDATDGVSYVFKVANAQESADVIDFENGIFQHVARVAPELPVPRVIESLNGSAVVSVAGKEGESYQVRLLSWLDGTLLRHVQMDLPLHRQLGESLARLGLALRGFYHRAAKKPLLWDLTQFANLEDKVDHVEDVELRRSCGQFVAAFVDTVVPKLRRMRAQVIHNDLNPSNVLINETPQRAAIGIVDFGDAVHAPLICDVAVAMAYQLGEGSDPLAGALEFVSAYHSIVPLEPAEIDVLPDLIIARAMTTVLMTSWRAKIHPDNREYILRNAESAARNIRNLLAQDREEILHRLHMACYSARAVTQACDDVVEVQSLLQRRQQHLGSAYRLFYERPVHIVRGDGVWLHDSDGNTYLDAYNNVPMVGHSHPHVVAALSAQAAVLNSHTRYLHTSIVDYAERLLGLFPAALNRVMFGCTGSEANELALRIARTYTGNTGVIATRHAYHGNTLAMAQVSPSYATAGRTEDWVELVPPPDAYRAGGGEEGRRIAGQRFLADIELAIDRMSARGIAPAALLLDAGFTSDGMHPLSGDWLSQAAARVRAAGGIYIADEVQSGFHRFGESRWGFEDGDFVPDVVTLGKPMGNGHPLAATLTRSDVLDVFSAKTRYFNTFGGNPVSAAVGLAVLDVFERDRLADNSVTTGGYLHQQLSELASTHTLIGDVRGSGLFAGVELVRQGNDDLPATKATHQVVNALRERGVLISMIGPHANVLKIRPPLPFGRRHVDYLIDRLDQCLLAVDVE